MKIKNQLGLSTANSGSIKFCSVCGDKALGYNFNAVTCESCKAFFRRNALTNKEYSCPFNDDCKITIITRRFCQKCRLQKCFVIGMKKEYIMSEEDKVMKRKKIEQNRVKKRISGININNLHKIPIKIKCENVVEENGNKIWINNIEKTIIETEKVKKKKSEKKMSTKIIKTNKNVHSSLIETPIENHDNKNIINYSTTMSTQLSPLRTTSPEFMLNHDANSKDIQSNILYSSSTTTATTPPQLKSNFSERSNSTTQSSKDLCMSSTTNEFLNPNDSNQDKDDYQYLISDKSNASDIINYILNSKFGTKNTIDNLMKTPKDAVLIMSKIINSSNDALILIEHLISTPGDALHIISKIMNSPLDALTVFTQFMSSPTDALQIIQKIVNSPKDILQFMQQLMNSPENALQIMNKYMNSPIEALKIINKMMNNIDEQEGLAKNNINLNSDNKLIKVKKLSSWDSNFLMIKLMLGNLRKDYHNTTIINNSSNTIIMPNKFCDTNLPNPDPVKATTTAPSPIAINDINLSPSPTPVQQTTEEIIINIMEDVNQEPIRSNSLEAMLCEAIRIEYESYHDTEVKQDEQLSRNLNTIEYAKLRELITANEALYAPVDDFELDSDECRLPSNSNQANPELLRVINLTAVAVRRLIKMAKKINAFKNMCQEDQLALLKGGCIEMMILRSVMQYDEDQHTWKIPHRKEAMANIKADVLKLAKGNIYEKHERFISNFEKKWRSDMNIIPIMCAITLFSPDRPRTVHSDVIKLEQTSYYCLLRRYLESIYSGCEAKSTFLKLIQKIHDLQKLNEEVINVYLDVNPAQIEPLLIEIFDLKIK